MPKMKSRAGAAKRFQLTGSGKVRRRKSHTSHILTKKTTKRKRGLRQTGYVAPSDEKRVKRMIVS